MIDTVTYDKLIETLDNYDKEIRYSSITPIEKRKGWTELAISYESHFQNTAFFLYGIEKFKFLEIKNKNKFLNLYNKIVFIGLETNKPNFRQKSSIEQGIEFLSSVAEIFGPSLVSFNGAQIDLSSNPDFDSTAMPTYLIRPSEYKSIIEDWYVMWLEQKEYWGDSFDEKYFAHTVDEKGQIKFLNPIQEEVAYKKFWAKREALIDSWIESGRLKTKSPGIYLR